MRSKYKKWYRKIRTTSECRANSDPEHAKYVRAKRNPTNLPNVWDDYPITVTRSWKDSRRKQYRVGKRGKEHSIEIGHDWGVRWRIEDQLEQLSIPFRLEPIKESRIHRRVITTERIKSHQIPIFQRVFRKVDGVYRVLYTHQIGYSWVYKEVKLDEPIVIENKYIAVTGYTLTWWSDKDIGIEFILRKALRP